jgi:hypothetical protein
MVSIDLKDALKNYSNRFRGEDWIETYSGKIMNFLDIQSSSICMEDISQGLSNTSRFAGQIERFYSVAEHSVLVSRLCESMLKVDFIGVVESALMHDAAEAYIGDVTTPLKRLCPGFQIIEQELEQAIISTFGLGIGFSNRMVKEADMMLFEIERAKFRGLPADECKYALPEGLEIRCLTPSDAKKEFLARVEELGIQRVL